MVASVSFETTTYAPLPQKFEAGTPNLAGAIGLAAALHYIDRYGTSTLGEHERALATQARKALSGIPGVTVLSSAGSGLVSFVVAGLHPHDVGTILDREGVAIRTGLM